MKFVERIGIGAYMKEITSPSRCRWHIYREKQDSFHDPWRLDTRVLTSITRYSYAVSDKQSIAFVFQI